MERPLVGARLKNGALCIAARSVGTNADNTWVVLAYWSAEIGSKNDDYLAAARQYKKEYITWIWKDGSTFWGNYFLGDRDGFQKAAKDFEERR
jgi:hypothetical protein